MPGQPVLAFQGVSDSQVGQRFREAVDIEDAALCQEIKAACDPCLGPFHVLGHRAAVRVVPEILADVVGRVSDDHVKFCVVRHSGQYIQNIALHQTCVYRTVSGPPPPRQGISGGIREVIEFALGYDGAHFCPRIAEF